MHSGHPSSSSIWPMLYQKPAATTAPCHLMILTWLKKWSLAAQSNDTTKQIYPKVVQVLVLQNSWEWCTGAKLVKFSQLCWNFSYSECYNFTVYVGA